MLSLKHMLVMGSWALKASDWSWTMQHQVRYWTRFRSSFYPFIHHLVMLTSEDCFLLSAWTSHLVLCAFSGGACTWDRAVPVSESFAPGGQHRGGGCSPGHCQGSGGQRPTPGTPQFTMFLQIGATQIHLIWNQEGCDLQLVLSPVPALLCFSNWRI